MDNKYRNYQVLMLFLVAALLLITPFLPSSSRPAYVYLILNLLIIALGAEAGLLSVSSKPPEEEKKQHSSLLVSTKPVMVAQESSSEVNADNNKITSACSGTEKKRSSTRVVEKSASEKIAFVDVKMVDRGKMMKKCPSMPSLFFIGGGETEAEDKEGSAEDDQFKAAAVEAEAEEEEVIAGKVLSGQELFTKAENFIGNFYMQLKMQREESWKNIHDEFSQKAY